MGSSGIAGLKCLQWLFRGVQFICSAIILGINSYYIASMMQNSITVPTGTKAVEGISAVGALYTALGILLVCCCAGYPATSFVAMILDIGLSAAYIYVAVANRAGASSCSGTVDTVYGTGDANATPSGSGGGVGLPTFQLACRMETACLAAACVAILFFLSSILLEFRMNRNRTRASRPIRDADGEYINKSDYAGPRAPFGGGGGGVPYGAPPPQRRDGHQGLFGAFRRRGTYRGAHMGDPDLLPTHQQPGDVSTRQVETWGEVVSLHDSDQLYFNEARDASSDAGGPPVRIKPTTAPRPAADSYADGELADAPEEYNLYGEDENGNDRSETGQRNRHRENKAARMERFAAG